MFARFSGCSGSDAGAPRIALDHAKNDRGGPICLCQAGPAAFMVPRNEVVEAFAANTTELAQPRTLHTREVPVMATKPKEIVVVGSKVKEVVRAAGLRSDGEL